MEDARIFTVSGRTDTVELTDPVDFSTIWREPGRSGHAAVALERAAGMFARGASELALLDRVPLALAIYDGRGEMVHSTPHFSRLVSFPDLPSRSTGPAGHWRAVAPDGSSLAPLDFPCERALRGEIVSPGVDLLHIGRDGEGRWLNVSAAPIVDPDQAAILGIVLLCADTHDQVQASAFAARAGRRFKQFAENSGMAIWIADAGSEAFSYRNPLHLGLSSVADPVALRLSDWLDRVDEADRAAVRDHYDGARQGRTEKFEYWLRDGSGERAIRLRETSFPIRDDSGEIAMIGGMTENLTPCAQFVTYFVGSGAGQLAPLMRMAAVGGRTKTFASLTQLIDLASFLATGCVVIDLATTDDAEAHLATALAEVGATLPVIIVGTPDTPAATAVAAMRAGAADYLIAPVREAELAAALARACARLSSASPRQAGGDAASERVKGLSKREREVLSGLKRGGTNKSIGRDLGISPRTVEVYRSHLMERLNAHNLAELLQATHS